MSIPIQRSVRHIILQHRRQHADVEQVPVLPVQQMGYERAGVPLSAEHVGQPVARDGTRRLQP